MLLQGSGDVHVPCLAALLLLGRLLLASVASPIGTNLAAVQDWTAEYPFVDHFKMARPWFGANNTAWQDDRRPLSLDADGNVRSLLPGQLARAVVFTGRPADPGLAGRRFFVMWSGDGVLEYGNVNVIRYQSRKDLIQLKGMGGEDPDLTLIISLTYTNPADPLRNVRLVPASGGICSGAPLVKVASAAACTPRSTFRAFWQHHAAILFNPEFLAGLKPYSIIRFMDWQRTNNAPARFSQAFSQRAMTSHQFWTTERGVPLEVMIQLANSLNAHPWLCIPHRASDAYVTAFAQVVKQQLAAGLEAHVEYSNEVWNGMFDQTQWVIDRAYAQGLSPDNYTGMALFYSRRAQRIHALFKQALGGTQRLRRVMSTQAVVPHYTRVMLGPPSEGGAGGASATDLFAIAPYFGGTFTEWDQAAELKRLGADGIFDWLLGGGGSELLGGGALADVAAAAAEQQSVLGQLGVPLASYEGGQHLVGANGLEWDQELSSLLDAVNRDARMKGVYRRYLDSWRNITAAPLMHYVHCDRWSEYGRWGAKEYPTQPLSKAPKLAALLRHAAASP